MIYLDNARATRLSKAAEAALMRVSKENWLDIQAPYSSDLKILAEMKETYQTLYDLVGAKEEDLFYFTSGEAEAASIVLHGVLIDHISKTGKNHLITLTTENASLLQNIEDLEKMGCEVNYLSVNESGQVTPEMIEKALNPRTSIVVLSWVNALTGVIQPIWEIAKICKQRGVLLYVQASEIFAKLFFRFQDIDIDFLSFAGDKFHGPKASGGLFVKKGIKLSHGVRGKEKYNLPSFIAMGIAFQELLGCMDTMGTEIARLTAHFEDLLKEKIPTIEFFGCKVPRVPSTTCFAIPAVHADLLSFHLKQRGIFVSTGGGEHQKLERHLSAMGVSPLLAKGAISATLSLYTTQQEIETAAEAIFEIALLCQELSYV